MELTVKFTWYDDEKVWISSWSDERIGLALDSNSFDGLLEKVKIILYDVIEQDLGYKGEVKLKVETSRVVSMNVGEQT